MEIITWHYICIIVIICNYQIVNSCYIWGTDSGVCDVRGEDKLWRRENMPYCADAVNYPVCLPKPQSLPPTREFPFGRFQNHTTFKKDNWVQDMAETHIARQLGFEQNETMKDLNRDIFGHLGHVRRRFWKRPDCQLAFKNMYCWINFPRCILDDDLTLPTCRSACENFFRTCNYQEGLWRCGKTKWFNGYEPENPRAGMMGLGGNLTYLREYFPGQPFRKNKYTTMGVEVHICTPAITGAGNRKIDNKNFFIFTIIGISMLLTNLL